VESPTTIRPYEARDRDAVWSLIRRTPMLDGSLPTSTDMPVEVNDIAANFAAFWVAIDERDLVVGTVGVQDTSHHPATVPLPPVLAADTKTARLRRLDVDPEYQRRGIGRRLTEASIAWTRDAGYARILLDTTTLQLPAIACTSRWAFVARGSHASRAGTSSGSSCFFSRSLACATANVRPLRDSPVYSRRPPAAIEGTPHVAE
jgi:GNAT superfamily N-acetyltransferase